MTLYTGGSDGFVSSTITPIASGWSEPSSRAGLSPAVDQHLSTAHVKWRVESRTGAVTVVSRWVCDSAFTSSPQSGLTWFGFLFPLIEPGRAVFPHPALGKDSRGRPRKTRGTVW